MAREKRPFYERSVLRFECTRCGACCTGPEGEQVFLGDAEARAIARHLKLGWRRFSRRYLARSPEGERVLRMTRVKACIFLREDGGCGIYRVRPLQCRTYPLWPEIVSSKAGWAREARRCEGIGRGARIPLSLIRVTLDRSAEGE